MGEDTSCDKVPNPRNGLGILRSLNFQRDTEYLGETTSVGEAARLAHRQAGRQLSPNLTGDDSLVQLVHDLLVTKDGTICAFDAQAEKSALEDSDVSAGQMDPPSGTPDCRLTVEVQQVD
jgi:hypothetical protein